MPPPPSQAELCQEVERRRSNRSLVVPLSTMASPRPSLTVGKSDKAPASELASPRTSVSVHLAPQGSSPRKLSGVRSGPSHHFADHNLAKVLEDDDLAGASSTDCEVTMPVVTETEEAVRITLDMIPGVEETAVV